MQWRPDLEKIRTEETTNRFEKMVKGMLMQSAPTDDIEDSWENIKTAVVEKVLGEKERKRNEWYDEECTTALLRYKEARLNALRMGTR